MKKNSFENQDFVVPKDRLNVVFIIFLITGIGTLFPWNMLINADHYFVNYKLNVTNPSPAVDDYRHHFLSYLGIASKAPNIILQILNMCFNAEKANISRRISVTLMIQIIVFVLIIVCAAIDFSEQPALFFWLTMCSVSCMDIANGVYQGCVYGIAARFPSKYTNSITIGMNISGTIASCMTIFAIAVSPNLQIEAYVFFSFAAVMLSCCLVAEFFLVKNAFYQYYAHQTCGKSSENSPQPLPNHKNSFYMNPSKKIAKLEPDVESYTRDLTLYRKYLFVIRQIWPQLLNVILIYAVSFSIFPAVAARIDPIDFMIGSRYYSPVFCYLFFNLFATVGNFTADYILWPGPRALTIFCVLRIAFIPFFLYCNYQPSESWIRDVPVVFAHDWMFILGMVAMAWSAGYLSSLAMMYIPRLVPEHLSANSGMLGSLCIIVGIFIGINSSLLYPKMFTE